MADNNYYSQQPQPPGGGGRDFSSGGRRGGRGRGYRGRVASSGRFPNRGGRSFDAPSGRTASPARGRGSYYGSTSTLQPPPSAGRGGESGGRFAPPVASNIPILNVAAPESVVAPPLVTNTRGGGSRGGGRFYDSGRGRRGRGGRYSSSRGGRLPQAARGSFGATDTSSWTQSHETTGWNYERNPSFEASRNSSNNTEWNSNAQNQGGAPMEVDSTNSSDWADGRDRDWNNSNPASQTVLDGNDGTQSSNWNNPDGGSNWSSYRGGGGSHLQDSLRGGLVTQQTLPPQSRASASTRSVPFHDDQTDMHTKRKRGEAPPYNVGGQPFEEKRKREVPTSSYASFASLGEGEFQNPLASTTLPPTIVDEVGPSYSQPYRGSPWRGRGRGVRGRTRGRGRGRYTSDARGDYGQYSGGGPSNYHEGTQYQDSTGGSVAPGLSAYGPQSTSEFGRSTAVPPSDHTPFSQGETSNTSWGAFRRPSREGSPASRPIAPPPPLSGIPHLDAAGFSGRSASIGIAAVPKPTVSAGSYASLADESSPFVPQVAREPAAAPPLSYSAMDSKPVFTRPKSATPPPEPKPVQRPPTPPSPVGPPSGLMVALARLADLESQLDFALAKHSQFVRERELIEEQTKHLEHLPIGVEAFEEDLAKLASAAAVQEPTQ